MPTPTRSLAVVPLLVLALASPAIAVPKPAASPAPAPASGSPTVGISIGGSLVGPPTLPTGAVNTNLQWNSGIFYRAEPLGQYTEAAIGIINRSQTLGMNKDEVFETSGLAISVGAKAAFVHLGVQGEVSLLHQILPNPAAAGTLMFHDGAGVVVEPYLGFTLPFLKSDFSSLDLTLHYPVFTLLDPSIGPRLDLTLWVGTPPKGAKDDDEDEDDDGDAPKGDKHGKSGTTSDNGTAVEHKAQPGDPLYEAPVAPAPKPSAKPKKP